MSYGDADDVIERLDNMQDSFDALDKLAQSWKAMFEERKAAHNRLYEILTWATAHPEMPPHISDAILSKLQAALAREKIEQEKVS